MKNSIEKNQTKIKKNRKAEPESDKLTLHAISCASSTNFKLYLKVDAVYSDDTIIGSAKPSVAHYIILRNPCL